jgi:uncharacterized protein
MSAQELQASNAALDDLGDALSDGSNDLAQLIHIVIARVNPSGQPEVRSCRIRQGLTAAAALRQLGWVEEFQSLPVMGIFSQKIAHPEQYVLKDGDRLELYQSLILTPMEVRRARARAYPVGRLRRQR